MKLLTNFPGIKNIFVETEALTRFFLVIFFKRKKMQDLLSKHSLMFIYKGALFGVDDIEQPLELHGNVFDVKLEPFAGSTVINLFRLYAQNKFLISVPIYATYALCDCIK